MDDEYITKEQAKVAFDDSLRLSAKEWNMIFEGIDELPAADVAPVIRCKDCDLWNEWDHSGRESLGNFRCSCAYWSVEDGPVFFTAPTDFCSYAEPKEEP